MIARLLGVAFLVAVVVIAGPLILRELAAGRTTNAVVTLALCLGLISLANPED